MSNLLRRLRKLEAQLTDSTRLVPHSPAWLAYWTREVEAVIADEQRPDGSCRSKQCAPGCEPSRIRIDVVISKTLSRRLEQLEAWMPTSGPEEFMEVNFISPGWRGGGHAGFQNGAIEPLLGALAVCGPRGMGAQTGNRGRGALRPSAHRCVQSNATPVSTPILGIGESGISERFFTVRSPLQ